MLFDGENPVNVERLGLALEPETDYGCNGLLDDVVFPSATDLRADGALDVHYGAADYVIAAARVTLPRDLPASASK